MTEQVEKQYPARIIVSRAPTNATPYPYVAIDTCDLYNDAEVTERLGKYHLSNQAFGTAGLYEYTITPSHEAEAVAADIRRELSGDEKDEPEDDASPSGPMAPDPQETDRSHSTTDASACQTVATLTVAYEGLPPWPAVTKATGKLLGFEAEGLTRAHSTAETRLLLTAEGYRPDFTKWVVLDRGGENVRRREVWVREGEPEPAPAMSTLDHVGTVHEPDHDRDARIREMARDRAAAEGRELPAFGESANDWHRQNHGRLNRYGGAVRI